MGKIRTKELANGNLELEITYGGVDAPFGGVDTSAPPAYIDPRCFVSSDGSMVVNNKICAMALEPIEMPTLWNSVSGVLLIGFGTFYNSTYGQLNYVLGYIATPFAGPPSGVSYTFYITSWIAGSPATFYNDTLTLDLYDSFTPAVAALLTLPCIPSSSVASGTGSGATGNISAVSPSGTIVALTFSGGTGYGVGDAVEIIPTGYTPTFTGWIIVDTVGAGGSITGFHLATNTGGGYTTGAVTAGAVEVASTTKLDINGNNYSAYSYVTSITAAGVVSELVNSINTSDPNVNAQASIDGTSIILTAKTAGAAGNSITVQDLSTAEVAGQPPPFYFPASAVRNLQGGKDQVTVSAPRSFGYVSSTSVGGTVYFANLGPMILKYSGPGAFAISSMYQGVTNLAKFAGSLIGIGVIPQLGFQTQDQDMILAWTAGGKLDIWNPEDGSGNVTGAGFEQLADIGEFLSGLIVSNGTAFILRKEGVSYATATGNALQPFSVSHIGLGAQGEGTQVPSLVTQYDSVGCYVGNSDVWQLTGSISSIGAKIKSALFAALQNEAIPANQLSAASGAVFIGGNEYPIAVFAIGMTLYIFNTSNGTWSTLGLQPNLLTSSFLSLAGTIASENIQASSNQYGQAQVALMIQNFPVLGYQAPRLYVLSEVISDASALSNWTSITFPQEEILFGRDVTIDALYIALQAQLQEAVTLNFFINGNLYASYSLAAAAFTDVNANPTELQIFPASGIGVNTGHSPQLEIQIINGSGVVASQLRFTKITMFGSIDASQRPV